MNSLLNPNPAFSQRTSPLTARDEPQVITIDRHKGADKLQHDRALASFLQRHGHLSSYCTPALVHDIGRSLHQVPYFLVARADQEVVGFLAMLFIKSALFGRFLISVPYFNWAGVLAEDARAAAALVDSAVELADELNVHYLELRNSSELKHQSLTQQSTAKVQMRIPLLGTRDDIWKGLKSEVRTQIRKASKHDLKVAWGGEDLLSEFYSVFSINMRDLGTPVYPRGLFRAILHQLSERAEIGVVRLGKLPIAACMVTSGGGITEVPSAGALRAYRSTAANSLLYWETIERAVAKGQTAFDFGRSTIGSSTFEFKRKWGAKPIPIVWQYYLRDGDVRDMRPDNPKFQLAIKLWKRLPLQVTQLLGPLIVRGIP
jgi:serine/alanine adding enzyme